MNPQYLYLFRALSYPVLLLGWLSSHLVSDLAQEGRICRLFRIALLSPMIWLLLLAYIAYVHCEDRKFAHIDEILQSMRSMALRDTNMDTYSSLRRFDRNLDAAYKLIAHKNKSEEARDWAKLGLLFYERDLIYKQGGTNEALLCMKIARRLHMSNYRFKIVNEVPSEDGEGIDKALSLPEQELAAVLANMKNEIFAWLLQEGILSTLLGYGKQATEAFDMAYKWRNVEDRMKGVVDMSTLSHHRADVHLKLYSNGSAAAGGYKEGILLDPCGLESKTAYVKYIQSLTISPSIVSSNITVWHSLVYDLKQRLSNVQALCKRQAFANDQSTIDKHHHESHAADEEAEEIGKLWGNTNNDDGDDSNVSRLLTLSSQKHTQVPIETMLSWALFNAYDHMYKISTRPTAPSWEPETESELEADKEAAHMAQEYRREAWQYLRKALEGEKKARLGASGVPPSLGGYSLQASTQGVQALLKRFTHKSGFWPPEHLRPKVGYHRYAMLFLFMMIITLHLQFLSL